MTMHTRRMAHAAPKGGASGQAMSSFVRFTYVESCASSNGYLILVYKNLNLSFL